MTAVKKKRRFKPQIDKFAKDEIKGEYSKPGPQMDPDAAGIAAMLSKITKREKTGVVLNWRPDWLKRNVGQAFSFYFHEDLFAVDVFNRNIVELDALADDLTQDQRAEIAVKTVLCNGAGIAYMAIGPDDDLDVVTIAAKLQKTSVKKGSRPTRTASNDGITEEGNDNF